MVLVFLYDIIFFHMLIFCQFCDANMNINDVELLQCGGLSLTHILSLHKVSNADVAKKILWGTNSIPIYIDCTALYWIFVILVNKFHENDFREFISNNYYSLKLLLTTTNAPDVNRTWYISMEYCNSLPIVTTEDCKSHTGYAFLFWRCV